MENTKLKIEMAKDGEVSINGFLEEKDLVEVTCHLLNVASTALAKARKRSKLEALLSIVLSVIENGNDESVENSFNIQKVNLDETV